jgi:hypothetical protein
MRWTHRSRRVRATSPLCRAQTEAIAVNKHIDRLKVEVNALHADMKAVLRVASAQVAGEVTRRVSVSRLREDGLMDVVGRWAAYSR